MIDLTDLAESFKRRYGKEPRLFRAPGRVNLIGEHTDYNDGFVLPIAINQETVVAIAPRPDRALRVWSLNLDDSIELDMERLGAGRRGSWGDYVEGIASALLNRQVPLTGADIALKSGVSIGGGLSSSAALEMALGIAMVSVCNSSMDKLSLALAGQSAEHTHVGIQCGIMDQYTSVHAERDHALLLDCRSLKAEHIPLRFQEHQIVVCDSRVRHTLASSEYNQRRRECELGVQRLRAHLPGIRALRDVTLPSLERHRSSLSETVFRRCRHVVTENARTLRAAEALASGNAVAMGKLMSASHQSLRDDYEVSCRELDLLADFSRAQPGVLGARMTGGGFGGCTVNLVERRRVKSFQEAVSEEYRAGTQITPEIFAVEAEEGAREIESW